MQTDISTNLSETDWISPVENNTHKQFSSAEDKGNITYTGNWGDK